MFRKGVCEQSFPMKVNSFPCLMEPVCIREIDLPVDKSYGYIATMSHSLMTLDKGMLFRISRMNAWILYDVQIATVLCVNMLLLWFFLEFFGCESISICCRLITKSRRSRTRKNIAGVQVQTNWISAGVVSSAHRRSSEYMDRNK